MNDQLKDNIHHRIADRALAFIKIANVVCARSLRCSKLPVLHEVFKGIFGEVAAMNQVGTHRENVG